MLTNAPLKSYTTFKIGGSAPYLFSVRIPGDVVDALALARTENLPWTILGGGSNILFSDEGYPGVVLKMEISGIMVRERSGNVVEVSAGAGESWDGFVETMVARGLWGLENLSFIPGTVGAAPIQNIGAYGAEVADVISHVEVFDTRTAQRHIFSKEECRFGYRTSLFKDRPELIVTRVAFLLSLSGTPNLSYKDLALYFSGAKTLPSLKDVREAVGEIRSRKFPDLSKVGTAGSYFKNPVVPRALAQSLTQRYPALPLFDVDDAHVKIPLAWILDNVLALRGFRRGDVSAYERQPLVLVNCGNATAHDVRAFADAIAQRVFLQTGITITPEVVQM